MLACVIPVGQLGGYAIAPLIMTVNYCLVFWAVICPPPPAKVHILHIFLLFCSQKISKKLQYIGATLFMAASLGILSLSYWAQVILKNCFISNCQSIPQTSNFEATVLPQVGLVIGSLGLTLFYGMGGLSLLHSMHFILSRFLSVTDG